MASAMGIPGSTRSCGIGWPSTRTRRDAAGTRAIDANQRTQVLRMVRRGERVDHIAAELRVPRHEVELLQKVQRALAKAV